jgi:hypothetical protein
VDVVDDEDSFAAARGAGGVVSEAHGAGGGGVDVEGTREVEGGEDINTSATITPSIQILGPIT